MVISLNFLHSDFRHLPSGSLCLQLSPLQENIFSYLRSLIWACFDKEQHARELTCFVSELGLSTFPYPRDSRYGGIVPHSEEGPEALRPYRDVDPSRLKISGEGDWRLQEFLEPELLLPYLEPKTLRSIPRNSIPFALVGKEDPARTEQLLRLWDSRGLLYLSFEAKQERELSRVFSAYKSEAFDRQIGDRRGANFLEGKVEGPSRSFPLGIS